MDVPGDKLLEPPVTMVMIKSLRFIILSCAYFNFVPAERYASLAGYIQANRQRRRFSQTPEIYRGFRSRRLKKCPYSFDEAISIISCFHSCPFHSPMCIKILSPNFALIYPNPFSRS
jgi:hypothetical protein